MTFCELCNKQFANQASFRSHRSKFHRKEESDNFDKWDIESEDKIDQTDSDHSDVQTEEDDGQTNVDTESEIETIKKKRRFNPYPPKSKDNHVYRKLSIVHDILKTHLRDAGKVYKFSDCYTLKHHVFDKLVPSTFGDEKSMQDVLSEEEFYIAQMVRDLTNLADIHAVVNEEKYIRTIAGITNKFLKKIEEQRI